MQSKCCCCSYANWHGRSTYFHFMGEAGGYKSRIRKEPQVREQRSGAIRDEVVGMVINGREVIQAQYKDLEGNWGCAESKSLLPEIMIVTVFLYRPFF